MTDNVSPEMRSLIMSKIHSKDTKPECILRSLLHRKGLRFRLHRADLPGTPDLVFPRFGVAVFVNGCFWHQHPGCSAGHLPKSRLEYWEKKLLANVARDEVSYSELTRDGWKVIVVWECDLMKYPSSTADFVAAQIVEKNLQPNHSLSNKKYAIKDNEKIDKK